MIAILPQTKRRSVRRRPAEAGFFDELIVDNFAGGGGASLGLERALGRAVDIAVNHDAAAVAMHQANHPRTLHLCEDVFSVRPEEVTAGRPVGLAWFSPDCTHHSRAKGAKPRSKKIRGLAWVVVRWCRTVRPRVVMLENVREFEDWGPLDRHNMPCPRRRGHTFRQWVKSIRDAGYAVEWRVLDAADFGAPTHRRRLFLIARCDGEPIAWPEPTHGPGRAKPWRTAAECIDWSLPCPSIFLTREEGRALGVKRPLAEKTMARIFRGVRRYVIEAKKPFIVTLNHGGPEFRGHGADEPMRTLTASRDAHGLVIPTITNIERSYSEYPGIPADRPLGTVTAHPRGGKHALVAASIQQYFGGMTGKPATDPLPTVTATDHNALAAAFLSHFNHGGKQESDPREPMRTVTAGGLHAAEVRAFLMKYYGQGVGQDPREPLHTVTATDRFGLVVIDGEPYEIVDIGLRMLTPRELARAQGFPDEYRLLGTKSEQVAKIGNSVCPCMSEALARANLVREGVPS